MMATILLAIGVASACAQPLRQEIAPFEVRGSSGDSLINPFAGGFDLTRIGLLDVDGDGLLDLLTYNLGERMRLYRNEGIVDDRPLFRRRIGTTWDSLPIQSWFRFADLDGDGDPELFTSGARSQLLIGWNDGSAAAPRFAPFDTLRQSGGDIIYSEQLTVPTFADIDDDGDLDLFSGNVDGTITFYENQGTPQAPSYIFRTGRFEGLIVISPARAGEEKGPHTAAASLHGASVLDFIDLDGDGDLDILFGDFYTEGLLHFENRGSAAAPDFDTLWVDSAFSSIGDRVAGLGFTQAVSGDLDRDGDFDVVVSSLLASAQRSPLEIYINRGTATAPQMKRAAGVESEEIDVGRRATPAVIDDEERRGVLIGSEDGSLTSYDLIEEAGRPVMQLRRRYRLEGVSLSAPAAGDLDGDGVAEIIVGKGDALDGTTMRQYRFDGDELVRVAWQLDTTFNIVRSGASPALADIDGDGDLDLFVGGRNGRFALFENIGTPAAPRFVVATPPPPFDTLDVGSSAAPRFGDLDGDHDLDLIVGSESTAEGTHDSVRFWFNEEGIFRDDPAWPPLIDHRHPAPLPLTLGDDRFLLIGTASGGLVAYRDTTLASGIDITPPTSRSIAVRVVSGTAAEIVVTNGAATPGSLTLYDLTGRRIGTWSVAPGTERITLAAAAHAALLWRSSDGESGIVAW